MGNSARRLPQVSLRGQQRCVWRVVHRVIQHKKTEILRGPPSTTGDTVEKLETCLVRDLGQVHNAASNTLFHHIRYTSLK